MALAGKSAVRDVPITPHSKVAHAQISVMAPAVRAEFPCATFLQTRAMLRGQVPVY